MTKYLSCILLLWLSFCTTVFAQEDNGILYNGIMVVEQNNNTPITGDKIATIKFKDKILTSNCSYVDVVNSVAAEAREKGGNLMKITAHKESDVWSTCHRITADVYKVSDTKAYETQIEWSAARKLTADDFKGHEDTTTSSSIAAETYAGLGIDPQRVSIFKAPKFVVHSWFYCYNSWFKQEHRNNIDVLQHEQLHFDICEVYARKLLKALIEARLTAATLDRENEIFKKISAQYNDRQKLYDDETQHGKDKTQQQAWATAIAGELQTLDAYKRD